MNYIRQFAFSKKIIYYLIIVVIISGSSTLWAKKVEEWNLKIEKIPQTVEEFTQMRNELAKTPAGGAAMFVIALEMYVRDEKLGLTVLTIAVDKKFVYKDFGEGYYKGYKLTKFKEKQINRYIKNKFHYLPKSYFHGTNFENGYKLPQPPYKMYMFTNNYSYLRGKDYVKVFVASTGANPTPITLKKNNKGIWKGYEWSSFLMGVKKPPTKKVDDDL